MATRNWEEYVKKRFKAQRNIAYILKHGVDGIVIPDNSPLEPATVDIFRNEWGETINDINGRAYFRLDTQDPGFIRIPIDGGQGGYIYISFIGTKDEAKDKISKQSIRVELLKFLHATTGMTGEQAFERQVDVIRNVRAIIVSIEELEGGAKNEIIEFNTLLDHPIRHFTLEELQFNPTLHATGPKLIRLATREEVQAYIIHQRGLLIGRNRLVPEFEANLKKLNTESERNAYINSTDEEILDKMPTMNTSDPLAKWYGFKVDDVLMIWRRIGKSKFTYRRVVAVDRIAVVKVDKKKDKESLTNL